MKIGRSHEIGFFDIDPDLKLRVQSTARFFQEMATFHSTQIGAGPSLLFEKKKVWLLHRLEMEFFQYPGLGEKIRLETWSRGFKGYKGFREYHITSAAGDIARGSSVWLFFDTHRKRISKVLPEISSCYEIETEKWFDTEIDDWIFCGRIHPEQQMDISLRYSDFDVNGHVNNTIYLGFLESLYHQTINMKGQPIRNIKIRFNREISRTAKRVQAGWKKVDGLYYCNIFDKSSLYADAQIIPMDV